MTRHPSRRFPTVLAAALALAALASPPGARAVETSITILYAPANPLVANASYQFTAKVEPEIDGATVQWTVSGALFATDDTNPNGVSQVDLVFGPGGYGVLATLVGGEGYDWAFSETLLVEVTPDPARLPDRFSLSALGAATITASGEDVSVNHLVPNSPQNRLAARATSISTGAEMGIGLIGPEGSQLTAGVFNPADTPRQTVEGAEGSLGNCDNGASTGGFAVLNLERGSGGFPIGFTLVAEYACANHLWPRVGWLRYNDSTPIPSLSLPDASPSFDPVIEGVRGEPVDFPITNDGEVPVTLGRIALTGADAAAWELGEDLCSGETLAPAEGCSFRLTFAPSSDGARTATIELPSDLPVSPRRLRIGGQALIRTSVSAPVVRPDTQYLAHGVRIEGTVTPPTEWNTVVCTLDGEQVQGSGIGPGGTAFCLTERPEDGIHEAQMHYVGSHVDGPSTSPVTSFTVDGTTTTVIEVDDPQAEANVPVTVDATVGFAGDLAYPGGVITITDETTGETVAEGPVGPESPSLAVVRTFSAGPHHLVASYAGITGVQDPSTGTADLAIAPPDLVAPVATPPAQRLRRSQPVTDGRIPLRLTWTGSDVGSGIDRFEVRRQVDGGSWSVIDATLHGTTLDVALRPGHRYRFAVRSIDRAGNASAWATASAFNLRGVQESNDAVTLRAHWTGSTSVHWWRGAAMKSRDRGATASLHFTGTSVAWVTAFGPGRGRAQVWVDGVLRETIDLEAPSLRPQRLAWVGTWATVAARTVVIRVVGRDGGRVDIDGFAVIR